MTPEQQTAALLKCQDANFEPLPARACSSCIHCKAPLNNPVDVKSGVCTDCYENIVLPAYKHVQSLTPDDPIRVMWHGWAVREAFIAGALHAKTNNSDH